MKTLKVEAVYLMDYETCRTPGSNGAVRRNTPLHPIAEWGRQRFGGADVPPAQRVVAPPFDGRVGHARLREVISECFRLGRRRSGAAPLRVSEAIAHLGKAIEMADKAGEGAPRAPRPYCQASG